MFEGVTNGVERCYYEREVLEGRNGVGKGVEGCAFLRKGVERSAGVRTYRGVIV